MSNFVLRRDGFDLNQWHMYDETKSGRHVRNNYVCTMHDTDVYVLLGDASKGHEVYIGVEVHVLEGE